MRADFIGTHRLIPAKYSHGSVLEPLAGPDDLENELRDIFALDDATNDRLVNEIYIARGITPRELVWNVPHAEIIRAAFLHPNPLGGRFNSPERGAWYAGLTAEDAIAEAVFHHNIYLAEMGWPADAADCDAWLADFHCEFHDIRNDPAFADCHDPHSYRASQRLAEELLEQGSNGIVYRNVRRKDTVGTNLVCFRPPLVSAVRKGDTWRFLWKKGNTSPAIRKAGARTKTKHQ